MDSDNVKTAMQMILHECIRHVAKGYTASKDDAHVDKSLARASFYILSDYAFGNTEGDAESRLMLGKLRDKEDWPALCALRAFQRYPDPLDRLRIAASLVVKEMTRLLRAHANAGGMPVDVPADAPTSLTPEIAKAVAERTPAMRHYIEEGNRIPEFGKRYSVVPQSGAIPPHLSKFVAILEEHGNVLWWHLDPTPDSINRGAMLRFQADDAYAEVPEVRSPSISAGMLANLSDAGREMLAKSGVKLDVDHTDGTMTRT